MARDVFLGERDVRLRVVADLIERKFNIRLGVSAVGELLAKLGLTTKSRCNGPISATQKRLRHGGVNGFLPLPDRQKPRAAAAVPFVRVLE